MTIARAGAWPLPTLPGEAIARRPLDGFGSEPTNSQPVLPDSTPPPPAPTDGVAVCTFAVFVNDGQQVESQWVTTEENGVLEFQLLRGAVDGGPTELVTTIASRSQPGSSAPVLYTWLDVDANPDTPYIYWLRAKTDDGALRDLAFSTQRATYHIVYLSSIHSAKQ